MTEQSTPTPTDDLGQVIADSFFAMEAGDLEYLRIKPVEVNAGDAQLAHDIRAAGWKSPAEIAELVRAGAEEAWDQASKARRFGLKNNPHRKPTPETVPSDV